MRKFLRWLLGLSTPALVGMFTLADLLAGYLAWLHERGVLPSRFFRLARDRGFEELLQYAKLGVVLAVLSGWRRVRPSPLISAWMVLILVMLLDDALGLHEALGGLLMRVIPFPDEVAGGRAKDLAEACGFALMEGLACLNVAFRYLKAPPDLRSYSRKMVLAIVPVVVFGLAMDAIPAHRILLLELVPDFVMEEAGEMLALTILLAFVHGSDRARRRQSLNAESGA